MPTLLIRNARVLYPDGHTVEADVACAGGVVDRIEPGITRSADEELDAAGLLLMPGVIDPQVHFREPGAERKEDLGSGSRAAVAGGVTSFLEMPNTHPPTIDQAALEDKLARAASKCVANYGFFIGATPDNLDAVNTAAPVAGIKIFMGSSTGSLLVHREQDLERIFANGERLIAVHAEDEARIRQRTAELAGGSDPALHSRIRDSECAAIASRLALDLSRRHRRRLHILHLSTATEVELLRTDKPAWVSCEAIPNHLFLDTSDYASLGTLVQMNPPIRSADDRQALWRGLHDSIIDCIATDHAPHTLEEKNQPYPQAPSGMPGVQTSLPLLLTEAACGRCSLAEVQRWMCEAPARLYGIPNKAYVQEGRDADLVLVDMNEWRTVRNEDMLSRAGWTPWAGRHLTGWPRWTIVGGQVVFDGGRIREGVYGSALTFG